MMSITRQEPGSAALAGTADADGLLREAHYGEGKSPSTARRLGPLVVLLPSLQEGVSNAVMEAMAAGRPIATSAVGVTPELLHGRGVQVPPGDPAALGSALRGLLAEPTRGAAVGAPARQWSRAHLRADAMVAEHAWTYTELLGRRCAA